MSDDVPGWLDPYKLAKKQQTLQGKVALTTMQRAGKLLVSDVGDITYALRFVIDPDDFCVISGEMHGTVQLCCQRCLQAFTRQVDIAFAVSPVVDDNAAKNLPPEYEAVMLQDGKIDALALLEDGLILELPIVARHESGEAGCEPAAEVQGQDLNQPFQVLRTLQFNKKGHQAEDK